MLFRSPVINVEMQKYLPTAPENFKKALKFDEAWWTQNGAALTQRFAEWQAQVEAAAAAKEAERKAKEAAKQQPVSKAAP